MAYDAAIGKIVLFGGFGPSGLGFNVFYGDTWTYNGTTWTKEAPATSPRARQSASMAYDAAIGEIVVFSGSGESGAVSDTWTYDGTTWSQQGTRGE